MYGRSEHRLTYTSVQVSLITVFLKLDLDFLCAMSTTPSHLSWNLLGYIMSTLKGRFTVCWTDTAVRGKRDAKFETVAAKCNSLGMLYGTQQRPTEFRFALLTMLLMSNLLVMLLKWLEFKIFSSFFPATKNRSMIQLWKRMNLSQRRLFNRSRVWWHFLRTAALIATHFRSRNMDQSHVLPASQSDWQRKCLLTFMSWQILFLEWTDTTKTYDELLGAKTDVGHRPSIQTSGSSKGKKALSFSASAQHISNVDLTVQCNECSMQWLQYCIADLS